MKFFLAGIMQGSRRGIQLHSQDYRPQLRQLIQRHFPGAEVYDPWADHENSVEYDEGTGRSVFYRHNRLCREVDVVMAYVPEASMGTAIEMWEAHEHGRGAVITISPLADNWAVRFCSHLVVADFTALEQALESGEVASVVARVLSAQRGSN